MKKIIKILFICILGLVFFTTVTGCNNNNSNSNNNNNQNDITIRVNPDD